MGYKQGIITSTLTQQTPNKLLLLDKDGTLITPASGKQFVDSPQDQIVLPGVTEAIKKYVEQEYVPIIVSNQGGVEAGYKTIEDTITEMQYCLKLLPYIKAAYFCPDFAGTQIFFVLHTIAFKINIERFLVNKSRDKYDSFRKPGAGMIQHAIDEYHSSPEHCIMIGDRLEDFKAASNCHMSFIWAQEWRSCQPNIE